MLAHNNLGITLEINMCSSVSTQQLGDHIGNKRVAVLEHNNLGITLEINMCSSVSTQQLGDHIGNKHV